MTISPAGPGMGINVISTTKRYSYRLHDKGPHILLQVLDPEQGFVCRPAFLLLKGSSDVVSVSHFDIDRV